MSLRLTRVFAILTIHMNVYVPILLCFVPLVFVVALCVVCVKGLKIKSALLAVALGLLVLIPVVLLQALVRPLPLFTSRRLIGVLLTALLFNGIIEETIKMCGLFIFPSKNMLLPAFLSCAAILGLALGCFETVIYLVGGQQNIVIRLSTAAVIHTVCAILSGLSVWAWKNGRKAILPFLYAVLVHGVYDFFAGFSGGFWWFSLAAICFGALECRIWYQKLKVDN
jgi:hypothetical protein